MIQTTLLDYIFYNSKPIKQATHKMKQLKQTSLQDYFSVKPKKKTILDYFKYKKEDKKENLKYVTISYRWGECNEQLVKTPDYIAHITSFNIYHLSCLCNHIQRDPDLKEIQYLWIDAISVDQQNHERKKETILKMSEIYKKATYILAVPDLHFSYLKVNPANYDALRSIGIHREAIHRNILNYNNANNTINRNGTLIKKNVIKRKGHRFLNYIVNYFHQLRSATANDEMKMAYKFLTFLVNDWSDRAWVISEYQIAKEKYEKHGTPLKYIFLSLLLPISDLPIPSYSFDHERFTNLNDDDDSDLRSVDSNEKFMNFLRKKFTQRQHLDMILNSNATRNEDRFHAILPSWANFSHIIKNKNTISSWNITDMVSVRLKLYELLDDLWDKARLLNACTIGLSSLPILPSYASKYDKIHLTIYEKDLEDFAYDYYESELKKHSINMFGNDDSIQRILNNNESDNNKKKDVSTIFTENLTGIQLNPQHHYLMLSVKKFFRIKSKQDVFDHEYLATYSLKYDDSFGLFWVPFFTFTPPKFTDVAPLSGSGILLVGNANQNKWVTSIRTQIWEDDINFIPFTGAFTFNIY
ncbi:hypothetical protein BJ944DRAFT_287451 [Cunninghamella echinulata]|nr:hypothetical protein BJ944DRAFT_287451 [Cunninghamella echinulata]